MAKWRAYQNKDYMTMLVDRGLTLEEIARECKCSEKTAKRYLREFRLL